MTEEDRTKLLNITNYELFENALASMNPEYSKSYKYWDEELLEHYNYILGLALEDYKKSEMPQGIITDVNVKLGND